MADDSIEPFKFGNVLRVSNLLSLFIVGFGGMTLFTSFIILLALAANLSARS